MQFYDGAAIKHPWVASFLVVTIKCVPGSRCAGEKVVHAM